jgi:hypothetical protein
MGIFSWLFKSTPLQPDMIHPVFGAIQMTLDNDDGTKFWETIEYSKTPKGTVGFFFDAPATGPSDAQVAQWHHIYENYETIFAGIEALIRNELRNYGIEDQFSQLEWSGVGLSNDGSMDSLWNLSFETPDGAILTVNFDQGVPGAVTFDT